MLKMLKKWNSKRWNFIEILDLKYLKSFEEKNNNFAEFFDKISNPHKKRTQKNLEFFWQVKTGKIDQKMSKIQKNKKTNCKRWNSENVLYCKYLHFFLNKNSRIF